MARFGDLIDDINNQRNDSEGEKGKWIKATKHSDMFNKRNPGHSDPNGGAWHAEAMEECTKGNILIYKIGHDNWFVLPEFEDEFCKKIPISQKEKVLIFMILVSNAYTSSIRYIS